MYRLKLVSLQNADTHEKTNILRHKTFFEESERGIVDLLKGLFSSHETIEAMIKNYINGDEIDTMPNENVEELSISIIENIINNKFYIDGEYEKGITILKRISIGLNIFENNYEFESLITKISKKQEPYISALNKISDPFFKALKENDPKLVAITKNRHFISASNVSSGRS